jgi:transcriptional regulator with XRE-family HTH domain
MTNTTGDDANSPKDFAHAFGDALKRFLAEKGIGQSDAARELGLKKRGGARLHSYLRDRPNGTRPKPEAEILYLLCTKLDFSFEYNGHKVSAETLNGKGKKPPAKASRQGALAFDRQFNLSDEKGTIAVSVRRPPDRIEISVSLKATAS